MHQYLEIFSFLHKKHFTKKFEYKHFTHIYKTYFKFNTLKISGKIRNTVVAVQ